jgi:hypothetical protein
MNEQENQPLEVLGADAPNAISRARPQNKG